jgi:hypothetical protein
MWPPFVFGAYMTDFNLLRDLERSRALSVVAPQAAPLSENEQYALRGYEQIIERGLGTFNEVGTALLAIRDGKLYRTEHKTFEDYCQAKWGMSHRHANRLIEASEVMASLGPTGPILTPPENERQLRELADVVPEARLAAWAVAVETAPGGKVTSNHMAVVAHVFDEMLKTGAIDPGDGIAIATSDIVKNAVTEETYERLQRQKVHIEEKAGRQKPKTNRAGDKYEPQGFDACQTPPYALDPLLPYLNPDWIVWEPAMGEGLLLEGLFDGGISNVAGTDILTGDNFFEFEPEAWDAIVTNPPYSIKYDWLKRCYTLGKPFALLLPLETLGAKTAQEMFKTMDIQVILLDRRINFKMPNIGFEGSSAQFPVAWFCWRLELERDLIYGDIQDIH